ncbi:MULTISPECIES: hypothetical protein [Halomicrobium]|uniref:Uncharacterized protein n=2 Tax=Halomicrobium mukohataei TaxID=57705 RepID=C7P2P5_HALMD|nr:MULTISPECIES: hypothetical protein [Halomicrobium]ACV47367.1 hypothetical protein Hmuk_1245 [Halomicrobium mukohataei DSM 12286]QCD65834.1 hypothetical protein E5139_09400 [Halomicrobium mukohataei]QFR20639.1 hypothetical protein GBQ70_09395 [Halomicrobium sp. ZPS1]
MCPRRGSDHSLCGRLDALFRLLTTPLHYPGVVRRAFREGLVTTGVSLVVFHRFVWPALVDDPLAGRLPEATVVTLGTVTPFDVLISKLLVAGVLGLCVGTVRLAFEWWQRATLPGPWRRRRRFASFLTGGVVAFAGAVAVAYWPLTSWLLDAAVVRAVVRGDLPPLHPFQWLLHVVRFCLACGVGAVLAYGMGVLGGSRLAMPRTVIVRGGTLAVLFALLGPVIWRWTVPVVLSWAGPIAVGFALGTVLAVFGHRLRGEGART